MPPLALKKIVTVAGFHLATRLRLEVMSVFPVIFKPPVSVVHHPAKLCPALETEGIEPNVPLLSTVLEEILVGVPPFALNVTVL